MNKNRLSDQLSNTPFKKILSSAQKLQDEADTLKQELQNNSNPLKCNQAEELLIEAKKATVCALAYANRLIEIMRDPDEAEKVVCKVKKIANAALALERVLAKQANSLKEEENLKELLH